MEISTIAGILAGFACIIISILIGDGGSLINFVDIPSVFIVFGGTFFAAMASFRGEVLKSIVSASKYAFKSNKIDLSKEVDTVVELATIARREGLLALEEAAGQIEDPFAKKCLSLIVDGTNPELVKDIMSDDIFYMQERHAQAQAVFESMASYAPAFGMIGTLIGLINMLQVLTDTDSLGPNMSVALVTTFYGVMLANLLFSPIARKLKAATLLETQRKELLLKGFLSISNGENPRLIRERLSAFVSHTELTRSKPRSRPGSRLASREVEEIRNG